jgi:hypothetical protein
MQSPFMSRRQMLKASSCGFGYLAFAGLAAAQAARDNPVKNALGPKAPHFPAKAKNIIFLCMTGGPSQIDTFDYKPLLEMGKAPKQVRPTPHKFTRHGQSGLPISDLFPLVSQHADDLCIINSMQTDIPNHAQSFLMLHTGDSRFIRPSMGSWLLYGLGAENQNLPGFITINPPQDQGGAQNYSNAFLPASFQATRLGEQGSGLLGAKASLTTLTPYLPESAQRRQLDLLNEMNLDLLNQNQVDPAVEGVINSFELGFRMQRTLPQILDLSTESKKTLSMYGIPEKPFKSKNRALRVYNDHFGMQCLVARRLVEAGVRFVELGHGSWDTHVYHSERMPLLCEQTDQPIAALLTDLKDRGMLDETIVMWGGEFGRTPTAEGKDGRDHNSTGFTMWLAGAGIKGGQRVGVTDDFSAVAVENPVHHHDLHATLLHLFGLDHQKLTYRYGGRDYSLTDIHGRVVKEILA